MFLGLVVVQRMVQEDEDSPLSLSGLGGGGG